MNTQETSRRSISEIKDIMERSTTFVSLSGMSGVISGLLALIGVYFLYVYFNSIILSEEILFILSEDQSIRHRLYIMFITIFILALLFSFLLSYKKAKDKNLKLFNSSSKRFAFNLFIPIITAVFIIIALISKAEYWMLIPTTLIFFGMSLINAGKYSRPEVQQLGIGCILSGIMSMFFVELSIILWGIGFGILNIITGVAMYSKYDRKDSTTVTD